MLSDIFLQKTEFFVELFAELFEFFWYNVYVRYENKDYSIIVGGQL